MPDPPLAQDEIPETESPVETGKTFENKIMSFFERLGFEVKGGKDFHIAPPGKQNQIDVAARYNDNILVIVECKSSGSRGRYRKLQKKDINDVIQTLEIALQSYKTIDEFKNCETVILALATNRIELPEGQKSRLDENKILHMDEQFIEYYEELIEKIGQYAVYSFLMDLSRLTDKEIIKEKLKVPAIRTKFDNNWVFLFYADPKDLVKISYVARRERGDEEFYQRMLEERKIRKIENFVNQGGIFPTDIVISLRGNFKEEYKYHEYRLGKDTFNEIGTNEEIVFGILEINKPCCWIVDGQHRLYGAVRSNRRIYIPCIAFTRLSAQKERSFFWK